MPETPNFGRYAEIPYDQMTPEQQEGYRSLIETRGQLGGPSRIWVHNPKLAKAAGPLGAHFHPGGYSLSEREREIAVCIINSKWHSAYPTNAHSTSRSPFGTRFAHARSENDVGRPASIASTFSAGNPTSLPRRSCAFVG